VTLPRLIALILSIIAFCAGVSCLDWNFKKDTMQMTLGLVLVGIGILGCILVYVRLSRGLRPEDLHSVRAKLKVETLEAVTLDQLAPFRAMPFFLMRTRGEFPTVWAGERAGQQFFLIMFEPADENVSLRQAMVLHDIRSPEAIVLFPDVSRTLPSFDFVLKGDEWGRYFARGGTVRRDFAKYYHILRNGQPIKLDKLEPMFVSEDALEFLARTRVWSCHTYRGHLIVWKSVTWGITPDRVPDLLVQAWNVKDVLTRQDVDEQREE
jgi:hypothetical protein